MIPISDVKPKTSPKPGYSHWIAMVVVAFACGLFLRGVDHGSTVTAADSTPDATATRAAELIELNDLRTRVAQTVVCTPPPEPTATSTLNPTLTPSPTAAATVVPPRPMNEAVPYGSSFTFKVLAVAVISAPDGINAKGQLLQVNVEIDNVSDKPRFPPFEDFRLVDSSGKKYVIHSDASSRVFGVRWNLTMPAGTIEERSFIFDVPVDAGNHFILESTKRPEFRIELIIEERG